MVRMSVYTYENEYAGMPFFQTALIFDFHFNSENVFFFFYIQSSILILSHARTHSHLPKLIIKSV